MMTEWMQTRLCAPLKDMLTKVPPPILGQARQLRLRTGAPALLQADRRYGLAQNGLTEPEKGWRVDAVSMRRLFLSLCDGTPYQQERAIREGFLSLSGGCRVGIAGQVILNESRQIHTVSPITSLSFRFAHALTGCANALLPFVWEDGSVKNTLLLSPPGMGKTTLLRDLVRQVSDRGIQTALLDERGELAACHGGMPQLDVGSNTDVIQNCPKQLALSMVLRSLSPELVAVDEIASEEECRHIAELSDCGVRILSTAHADSFRNARNRPGLRQLLDAKVFARIVLLSGSVGHIQAVYRADGSQL